ncbi:twin-arginine translocase subunit TatC [Corynebacterium sp. H127]|uniref:twin-arginine translocase subunit TatC n=1 Tax=Corynebacterium sp. H127 TaxID=3133418 RepID=UPI0030998C1B
MTLVEHIQELRRRLTISLLAIGVGAVIGFIWYQHSLFGIVPLGELLRGPYCELDPSYRADFSNDGSCRLLATSPFEMFNLRLKVGALAGLILSSPIWLTQIWGFVTPGLMKQEKRWTFIFVSIAFFLFNFGAVLAYLIMNYGLEFLLGIGSETQITALSGERYYSFFLSLLLVFGVSFEVPLLIAMLNIVGILEYESIKDKRRVFTLLLFIFAAFMTPGGDPMSMTALGCCLVLLVELAIQFCRYNDKRRGRQRPDWLDQDDDNASKLDLTPGGVDGPSAVTASSSISGSGDVGASGDVAASGPIQPTPGTYIRGNQNLGDLSDRPTTAFDDVL